MRKSSSGFTIVELLVVIIVIAILASITIVSYQGVQSRASDAAVMSDLEHMKEKLELFESETGYYPGGSTFSNVNASAPDPLSTLYMPLDKKSYAVSPVTSYNFLYCYKNSSDNTSYSLVARSVSGKMFEISSGDGGVSEYTGTWESDQNTMCMNHFGSDAPGTYNARGYASDDTTTGPWRAWVGGN